MFVYCKYFKRIILCSDSSQYPDILPFYCNRAEKVHVICYDRDPGYVHEVVPQELSKRYTVIHVYEPSHEKTNNFRSQPGQTQTCLCTQKLARILKFWSYEEEGL